MTSFQDSLLISTRTYNNDLAIVPDLFTFNRKRERANWSEDFLEFDVDLLYGQPLGGTQGFKRHCPGMTYTPTSTNNFSDLITRSEIVSGSVQDAVLPINSPPSYVESLPHLGVMSGQEKAQLVITEQPEQFYRARYDSEGVRAPLKGINENYPTVQIAGENAKHAVITVKLVHEDGSAHTCCSLDSSEDRKKALVKKVTPINNVMKAEFEDLRIRREKKKEGRKSGGVPDKHNTRDGKQDKVAYLLFSATIGSELGTVECSILSNPISLTAAPEPAELDWLEPSRGHFGGKEVVVIKGSKMTSPKVLFQVTGLNGELIEIPGTVDKEKSHQNVLLVRTPIISFGLSHQCVPARVVVITGRNQMFSNSLDFEFIPNDMCRECMQETSPKSLNFPPIPCQQSASLTVGISPCSPIPSSSPIMQRSPGPVFSPDIVQSRVSTPMPTSCLQLESMPRTPDSPALPPVTSGEAIGPDMPRESLQRYCTIQQPGMNYKENAEVMNIVQHLLSPVGNSNPEGNITPQYTSPCNLTPSDQSFLPADTFKNIEEVLAGLHNERRLSSSDFMAYQERCHRYDMEMVTAYNMACGDRLVFLQQLASTKPTSFHSTHL